MKLSAFPKEYKLNQPFKLKVHVDGSVSPEALTSYVIRMRRTIKYLMFYLYQVIVVSLQVIPIIPYCRKWKI